MIFTLTRVPDGPQKIGAISQSLVPRDDGLGWVGRENAWPTVGEQMLVGARFRIDRGVPGARITSPVKRIVTDDGNQVMFETESGSQYVWTCGQQH